MYLCFLANIIVSWCFFFQAEDGIRDLVRSRGLGDVYKRQVLTDYCWLLQAYLDRFRFHSDPLQIQLGFLQSYICLLYTSDAADERSSVDLGGRRIIKKKKKVDLRTHVSICDISQQSTQQ